MTLSDRPDTAGGDSCSHRLAKTGLAAARSPTPPPPITVYSPPPPTNDVQTSALPLPAFVPPHTPTPPLPACVADRLPCGPRNQKFANEDIRNVKQRLCSHYAFHGGSEAGPPGRPPSANSARKKLRGLFALYMLTLGAYLIARRVCSARITVL